MPDIHIQVVMPNLKKLDKMVDSAILPGVEGDFEVLPGHAAIITKLRPGVLRYTIGTDHDYVAIHEGFVTVENNSILVLTENSEKRDEIDMQRAEAAKERAEKRIANKSDEQNVDFRRAEIALKRAIARISTAKS